MDRLDLQFAIPETPAQAGEGSDLAGAGRIGDGQLVRLRKVSLETIALGKGKRGQGDAAKEAVQVQTDRTRRIGGQFRSRRLCMI
jgi:hypothetical protein